VQYFSVKLHRTENIDSRLIDKLFSEIGTFLRAARFPNRKFRWIRSWTLRVRSWCGESTAGDFVWAPLDFFPRQVVAKTVIQTRTLAAEDVSPIPLNPEFFKAVLDAEVGVNDADPALARPLQVTGAFLCISDEWTI
jgi:hypothetical protein